MTINKNVLLTVILLFSLVTLRGQNIPYKLYTPQDGLAQSQVTCLFQDSRGYIWVGTKGGLSYFNGTKFQSLTAKDGLPSSTIWQIQEDAKGNIRFTCGRWFCMYDGKKIYSDTANFIPFDGRFVIDNSQTAWCINADDKLLYSSKDYKNWECASKKDGSLTDKIWRHLVWDKKGKRLILRDWDLYVHAYRESHLKLLSKQRGIWFQHTLPKSGEINYGTLSDSIFLLQNDTIDFVRKTNNTAATDVIRRPNGKLYFITLYGKNLCTFNDKNTVDTFPLNVSSTTTMLEDRDKNVWIGTEEGLMRVYLDGFKNFKKEDLGGVWSMVEDTEGGMWFGDFYKHKLRRYDGKRIVEKTVDYALLPNAAKGDLFDFYFGGDKDKLGNLYFPSIMGIKKWDGKKLSIFTPYRNDNQDISLNFYLDTVRNIILSGTGNGFNLISLKNGATKFYGQNKGVYAPFYTLGVGKDTKGRYWLTAGNGISVFDIDEDKVTRTYTAANKKFPYFGSCTVFGDAKGGVWAGSEKGLLHYDEQKDSFVMVAPDIIHNSVNAIKTYKNEYLVIGASDGVYFLDLKAFYTEGSPENPKASKTVVRCFNQFNGYLGIEPNQNCLYIDSKDNVWVAASDIVTKITPSELNMVPQHLTPYITTINNARIPYAAYNETIYLPRGENTAKIFFEAVGFERPFNTEFRFKLDKENWSEWRTEDFAIVDKLSSGTYTFSVQTRPAGTVDAAEIKETHIQFKINMPFHKETYFPFLLLMAFMSVVVGAFAYFKTQKRREKDAIKRHEIDIEQRKNAELLIADRTHRVKNNLNIMQGAVTLESTRAKSGETQQALQKVVDRIQSMALLHDHLIAKKGVSSLKMSGYLEDLCDAVKKSYTDDSTNLTYQVAVGTIELPEKMGRDIGSVVCELVTNSIKHAFKDQENPHVTIHLAETPTSVLLVYEDNGCGIPTDFDWQKSDSLGMTIIHGIAESFKGKVKFENRQGLNCQISFEKKVNS